MLLLAAALFTSCKKSSNTPTTPKLPTVLLTKIIDNTPSDFYNGKSLAEFTYNGKQLSKAVIYGYGGFTSGFSPYDIETDLFNYDSQGHLTGTTISHSLTNTYNEISSTVTYTGGNISEIKFYTTGNVLDKDILISYQNGNLSSWFNNNEVNLTYTYNSSTNNTNQLAVEYQSGQPDGNQYPTTNTTFDSKSNLSQALPFWIYFRVYLEDQSFTFTPGLNNPLNSNDNGTAFSYNYQYNSNGYPSTISFQDNNPLVSYNYQYTQVN